MGLSGPLICVCVCVCFFLSLFVVVLVVPYWAHVEPCWAILGYFRVFVDSVRLYLGLGYFGVVAFWSCWAFILDLGISVLLGFGLVSLYFGLGHFSVVELWSCWPLFWTWAFQCRWVLVYSSRFPKNVNTKQNAIFGFALLLFLMLFFVPCFPFFFGHVALGLCWLCLKLMLRKNRAMLGCCCVLFSPCWANVEPPWSMLGPCWVMLLAILGRCCVEPMWTHVALIWSHVGPCWADVESGGETLGHIWYWAYLEPFWANIGLMLSHFGLRAGLYLVSVSLSFGSMQGVCNKYSKHKEKQHVLDVLLVFLMLCLTMFARYFSGVVVAFEGYFWWCMGGLLLVWWHGMLWALIILVDVSCVASARTDTIHINTQYQTILHTCGPWHLQRFSCPARHDLDKEKAAPVACDKVNKCKISSKKREWQPKRLCIFQGKRDFSCAFSIWLNGWRFYANASASSGSRQAKVQVTSI